MLQMVHMTAVLLTRCSSVRLLFESTEQSFKTQDSQRQQGSTASSPGLRHLIMNLRNELVEKFGLGIAFKFWSELASI